MDSGAKMKVLAINGSGRKHWNTAILLNKALEGAASKRSPDRTRFTYTTLISKDAQAAMNAS